MVPFAVALLQQKLKFDAPPMGGFLALLLLLLRGVFLGHLLLVLALVGHSALVLLRFGTAWPLKK